MSAAETEPSGRGGKLLVLLVLTTLPFAALVMFIGLSGGGRDPARELYWLGPLPPSEIGAPAPFDTATPGSALTDVQRAHQDLFGLPIGALEDGRHDDVVAVAGRSLGRTVRTEDGKTTFVFSSGVQTVTAYVDATTQDILRIEGTSMKPLEVPAGWPAPRSVGTGTAAQRLWSAKGVLLTLSEGLPQAFVVSAHPSKTSSTSAPR